MARFITSADVVLTLAVTGLFPIPQQIQDFSTDDVTSLEEVTLAETMMGVDGKLAAGFVFSPVPQTITLQASSLSVDFFDTLIGAMKIGRTAYRLQGTILIPGTGKSYNLANGVLVKGKQVPDIKKVLQPQQYGLVWESVLPAFV